MNFDIQILFLIVGSGILISGVVMLYISSRMPQSVRGGTSWGVGNILLFLGLLLFGMRGIIPEMLSVIVGNAAILYSVFFYYRSIQAVFDDRSRLKRVHWLPLIGEGIVLYFYFIRPDYPARAISTSLCLTIFVGLCVQVLLKQDTLELRPQILFLATIFSGLGLVLISRIVNSIVNYNPQTTIFTDYDFLIYFISFIFIGTVILSFGFVMLSNSINFLEIHKLAYRDFLTNVLSRRALTDKIESQISNFKRTHFPFSILLIDLDNLKYINDTYGHAKGDEALRFISSVLKASVRDTDVVGRYGGDEFVVVLENTNQKGAAYIAERIKKRLGENRDLVDVDVRVSIGGAQMMDEEMSSIELLDHADKALYEIKELGGGDYKIHQESP